MDNIFNDENLSDNDKLFIAQSKIIKDAALKGRCVIVGRCADAPKLELFIYISYLEGSPHVLPV